MWAMHYSLTIGPCGKQVPERLAGVTGGEVEADLVAVEAQPAADLDQQQAEGSQEWPAPRTSRQNEAQSSQHAHWRPAHGLGDPHPSRGPEPRHDLAPMPLTDLMKKVDVPGISVALIEDGELAGPTDTASASAAASR